MNVGAPWGRPLPLQWLTRDAWILILTRGSRTFARSTLGVLLGIYLSIIGFSLVQIGLFLSIGLIGGGFFAFVITFIGDTMGRRRLLVVFSLVAASLGVALAITDSFVVLATVAFLSSLSVGGGGAGGPLAPLEMASLPETAPRDKRTELFAVAGIVATTAGALGALAAGLPTLFQAVFDISEVSSYKLMFVGYSLVIIFQALFYGLLSPAVEVRTTPTTRQRLWTNPFRLPSRRFIFSLAGVSSVNYLSTGFVVQSLVALWFFTKFDMKLESIALIVFGTHAMAALSLWLAAKLANRFGLLNIIVLSNIPGALIVFAMPFVPYGWLAATLWLIRGFTHLMEMPTRQSFTMSMVAPYERSAMAGINNVTRGVAGAVSPTIATVLWNAFFAGAPFLAHGVLKIVYVTMLYFTFRNTKVPGEQRDLQEPVREASARDISLD